MIDILLATYNSSAYLRQTIDSILQQDCDGWQLLIGDGGSTDETLDIIAHYTRRHPVKIRLVSSGRSLSPCANFSSLLDKSQSDYVMFCDHDDLWLPDKISRTQSAMQQAQRQCGADTPLLVFTDMKVVDETLKVLSESNLKYQRLDPLRVQLNHLLLQNVPSGCSMMINRSLVELSRPIPVEAAMHDQWISLIAAAFGKIVFLDKATVLYRQHRENYYGAPKYGWGYFAGRGRQGVGKARRRISQYIDQAAVFHDRYAQSLPPHHRQMLADLARWPQLSWLERRRVIWKHRIFKTGLRRNVGMFLIV